MVLAWPTHLSNIIFKDYTVDPNQLFLPRDARNAKRGIAIVCCPSVGLCLSVRPFVTLTYAYRGHIGWTSSKLVT